MDGEFLALRKMVVVVDAESSTTVDSVALLPTDAAEDSTQNNNR